MYSDEPSESGEEKKERGEMHHVKVKVWSSQNVSG